jgi:ABC-type branched-subunit amino acid transport system substrate-binding protein
VPSYRIGALLPLSGPMAAFGQEVLHGIQLAIDRQNHDAGQVPIKLVVRDAGVGTPIQVPLSALLDEPRLLAVIGPLVSKQVEAAAKVVDDAKIPLITPSATLPNVRQLSPYVFSTALTYPLQSEQIAAYAMGQLGYRRFAVIHPENGFGRQLAQLFIEEVRRQGGEVIDVESYEEDETDFAKQITRLKSAYWRRIRQDRYTKAGKEPRHHTDKRRQDNRSRRSLDAIYLPGGFRQAMLIAAQLRFQDMKVRLLGSNAWHSEDLGHWSDKSIQGGIFVDSFFAESRTAAVREFVEAYRARYHAEPSMFAAQAYEAAQAVLEGTRKGIISGKKLSAFLEQADSLPTLQGPTSFNGKGLLDRKLVLLQVGEKGQLTQLQ